MLSINCKNCDGRCCTSGKRKLHVVLTPREKDKFKDFSTTLKTTHGILLVLKKSESGNCIFYDERKNLCKVYANRPFECRVYPLMIDFNGNIRFILDKTICPKIKECSPEEIEKTKKEWIEHHLPLYWIKAYSEIG